VFFIKYYVGDRAMQVEMGRAHDTYEVEHKYIYHVGFQWGNLTETTWRNEVDMEG